MTSVVQHAAVSIRRDVVHTRLDGFRPLSLDLYLPIGEARAVCVYLHGGGWCRGSRREGPGPLSPTSSQLFGRMAAAGVAVASVDYRLSGEARFPAQQHDAAAACRWLAGDSSSPVPGVPMVAFGVSAGGQLAALTALDANFDIRAAALWYPVTDLRTMPDDIDAIGGDADRSARSREAMLLGGTAESLPALAESASPVARVHAGAPAFLILHGDADVLVPIRQSVRLQRALCDVDVACELRRIPGYSHMFTGLPEREVEKLVDNTTAFLLSHVV